MNAIPTSYSGVQFRSRLEARWAAFFDLLDWSWEYEPIEMANCYIPDFVIQLHKPLLVEVKPAVALDDSVRDTMHKIDGSGWQGEAWIAPLTPLGEQCGWLRSDWSVPWTDMTLSMCGNHLGVGTSEAIWTCRVCGERLKPNNDVQLFLSACWRHTGNITQWRGADARPGNATAPTSGAEDMLAFFRKADK